MFFPIKLYTTKRSLVVIKLCIPYFVKFREGIRIKYSMESDEMYGFVGEKKDCLHIYYYMLRFRICSNKSIDNLKMGVKRFIFWNGFSYEQLFKRGII